MKRIKALFKNPFSEGLIWNYISLAILSLCGFFFNTIILLYYNASALGIFNQTYAWYCVLSQIAAIGIHISVLSYIPADSSHENIGNILISAVFTVSIISIFIIIATELLLPIIVVNRTDFLFSMKVAIPGLFFFSINKVLLNYINAISEMKAYAIYQSLRYMFIICLITIIASYKFPQKYLALSLALAELFLTVVILPYVFFKEKNKGKIQGKWIREHLLFGVKVFPANMVLELNAKVDIICLGLLLNNDYLIGIYSFAVLFTDGLYQMYVVVRRSINPMLAEADANKSLSEEIRNCCYKTKYITKLLLPAGWVILIGCYLMMCMLLNHSEYIFWAWIVVIIGFSIVVTGRRIIFGNIFSQVKFPEVESLINLCTVVVNIICNIILIWILGMIGAAIGTAISYVFFGLIQDYMLKKRLGVSIK